ncbi:thaumatin family protein [Streptomyces sp. NPDC004393]|uniref:thaumatin family protein n=1 Tax=Streptomyces sp. NPDC004533 TaxID=3154278 RepID=UPI0033A82BE2
MEAFSAPLWAPTVKPSACGGPCPSRETMRAVAGSQVVGCKPPCPPFGGDTYCCRGPWAGREDCVPAKWPVDKWFKRAAWYAYSYAFDDSVTTPCKGACRYRVTSGTTEWLGRGQADTHVPHTLQPAIIRHPPRRIRV